MNVPPSISPICDARSFLAFADRTARRLDDVRFDRSYADGTARALVARGSAAPVAIALDRGPDGAGALLDELGRVADVTCGVGIAVAVSYPGTAGDAADRGIDLSLVRGVAAGPPSLSVDAFFCALDDRSILEAFRFAERGRDGRTRAIAGREELALVRAFSDLAERAVAGLRERVGDRRARPLPDAFAAAVERVDARGRAFLEAAVDARELVPLGWESACADAGRYGVPCAGGPRFAWRGDTFGGGDVVRCANHLMPHLDIARAGLERLGVRRDAWFAERAAGVYAAFHCPACGARRDVPVVVTDRRVLAGAALAAAGLDDLFVARPATCACAVEPHAPLGAAAIRERTVRDAFGADLHLAWTCDVRAYRARGADACGLRRAAAGAPPASGLIDRRTAAGPRYDTLTGAAGRTVLESR